MMPLQEQHVQLHAMYQKRVKALEEKLTKLRSK